MNEGTRVTHVEDVTPKGAAFAAVQRYVGEHQGEPIGAHMPGMIAAAVDAWCSTAQVGLPQATVRLLRPQPGDVVVFHFAESMTQQEINCFAEDIKPATQQFEDVKFIAVGRCPEITVVRAQETDERTGLEKLREVANRPMSREEFDRITRGEADG